MGCGRNAPQEELLRYVSSPGGTLELDPERRRVLAERVRAGGQTLITATEASALPIEPAQLLEVSPGLVRAA